MEATKKDKPILPAPITATVILGKVPEVKTKIKNPAKGNEGRSQINSCILIGFPTLSFH
jgi:hypothetical protein